MCRGVFIMKGLPPETTARIFLAVSCWMAACVCFWKASLASHLHGSSTTSTFTSLTGDSKRSHDERGPRTAAATLCFLAKLLLNERTHTWIQPQRRSILRGSIPKPNSTSCAYSAAGCDVVKQRFGSQAAPFLFTVTR